MDKQDRMDTAERVFCALCLIGVLVVFYLVATHKELGRRSQMSEKELNREEFCYVEEERPLYGIRVKVAGGHRQYQGYIYAIKEDKSESITH